MGRGDHIYVHYLGFTHHGIDCGDGTVFHYTKKWQAKVSRVSWAEFTSQRRVFVKRYEWCYPPDVVIARAEHRLGEAAYNLLKNNCEHFATWCKIGLNYSEQIEGMVEGFAGNNQDLAFVLQEILML